MSYLNAVYQKFPLFFLLAHLAAGLGYCLYIAWFTTTLGGDTLEHIHSSWLVYAEFVPYKDFFQHHNPLLWYLFAPFVGLHAYGLNDNVITSSVVTAAILASFLTYYYLYLIASRFLTGKRGGVIAAAALAGRQTAKCSAWDFAYHRLRAHIVAHKDGSCCPTRTHSESSDRSRS